MGAKHFKTRPAARGRQHGRPSRAHAAGAPVATPSDYSAPHDGTQPADGERPARRAPSAARELGGLLLKLGIIAAAGWAIFTFVFGLVRVSNPSMSPNIKDGDLVLIDRLDHDYVASDIVVFTYRDRLTFARVVATAGDEVDIHDDALYVNGSYQQETWAQGVTTRFEGGVDLPLTVPEGSVFVLGDNRTNASDSRIIGTLASEDTNGTVIGIFRRRNL